MLVSILRITIVSFFIFWSSTKISAQYIPLKNVDMKGMMWPVNTGENCSGTNPTICPTYDVDGMNWYMSGVTGTPFSFAYSSLGWTPFVIDNRDYAMVYLGNIEVRDPNGAICFNSPVLNISGLGTINMSFSVSRPGAGTTYQWVNFNYRVNGGATQSSGNLTGGTGVTSTWNPTATGSTLELWACMAATGNTDVYNLLLMNTNLGGVLPVKWTGVFANIDDQKNVHINWSTTEEINNDYFIVERSMDDVHYEDIGMVDGSGHTNEQKNYTFYDENILPGNIYFYKIRQVDFDGRFDYSIPIKVEIDPIKAEWQIGPNPALDKLTVHWKDVLQEEIEMNVYTMQGQKQLSFQVDGSLPFTELDISSLPSGAYFISSNVYELKQIRFIKTIP